MSDAAAETQPPKVTAESPKAQRGPRGRVKIFALWCKGCRLCVEFCPTGVLEFNGEERPLVAHPEKCTACHWCDTHCPDLAIVVTKIENEGGAR